MKKILLFTLAGLLCAAPVFGQDDSDLLSLLGEEKTADYATASFKTNRVINGHSIENTAPGVLDFKISHRFAPLRQGIYDVFGLDNAEIRLGLDYGISSRFMVGIGRNSYNKTVDGFAKYKLLRQQTSKRNVPVTLAYLLDAQIVTKAWDNPDRDNFFSSRLSYAHQIVVGRKFNSAFSLQLMPTLVHRNLTTSPDDKNDVLAVGAAGRIKLTKRVAFNAEYYYVLPGQLAADYENSLSLGFDIETGGHVFQLHFTNSQPMNYRGFLLETTEPWLGKDADGNLMSGIRFGFNVSRVFTVKH